MKNFVTSILMATVLGKCLGQLPKKSETAKVNGIEIYYEVYGEGEPLLLLHGWTQSSAFWSEYIPTYANHFKVYAIDLRGHGRSSPVTTDFTIKKSSGDILALLDYLHIKKTKAIGFSYGGLALLELASSNHERIESMILIGVSQNFIGGENNDDSDEYSYENLPNSFKEELKQIHHHGESQIRALFDQNLNYQINLSDEEIKGIDSRTLIVQGDHDEILGVEPALQLFRNLPDSALWIVPDTGHNAISGSNLENFLATSVQFLRNEKP